MKTQPTSMHSSATGERSTDDFSSELMAPAVRLPNGRDSEKAGVTISTCSAPMKIFRIRHRQSNGSMANASHYSCPSASTALDGYGWVFPKREYVCVGIGGRVGR